VVDGRYVLEQPLGIGGMGEVWQAHHRTLKNKVAIKLIRPKWFDDDQTVKRFLREARSTVGLKNPHVVRVTDHGNDGHLVYIVMELLQGATLRRLIREADQPIALADVIQIFDQIGMGLAEAHGLELIHRDLKPGNIFIVRARPNWHAKLMDFGLAKPLEDDHEDSIQLETRQDALIGTPAYMSPERLRLDDDSIQADLWSLAIMAYELLVGQRPYLGKNRLNVMVKVATQAPPIPSDHGPVPSGFDQWFLRATAPDAEERFDSVIQLTATLKEVLAASVEKCGLKSMDTLLRGALGDEDLGETTVIQPMSLAASSIAVEGVQIDASQSPSHASVLGRTVFTPMEVAELQTQIQYSMMERLRAEHEKNQILSRELDQSQAKNDTSS